MNPRSWTCSSLTRKVGPLVAYHLSEKHKVSLQAVARTLGHEFLEVHEEDRRGLRPSDSNWLGDSGFEGQELHRIDLGFIQYDLLMKNHNNAKIPFAYALDIEGNSHASCNQQRW